MKSQMSPMNSVDVRSAGDATSGAGNSGGGGHGTSIPSTPITPVYDWSLDATTVKQGEVLRYDLLADSIAGSYKAEMANLLLEVRNQGVIVNSTFTSGTNVYKVRGIIKIKQSNLEDIIVDIPIPNDLPIGNYAVVHSFEIKRLAISLKVDKDITIEANNAFSVNLLKSETIEEKAGYKNGDFTPYIIPINADVEGKTYDISPLQAYSLLKNNENEYYFNNDYGINIDGSFALPNGNYSATMQSICFDGDVYKNAVISEIKTITVENSAEQKMNFSYKNVFLCDEYDDNTYLLPSSPSDINSAIENYDVKSYYVVKDKNNNIIEFDNARLSSLGSEFVKVYTDYFTYIPVGEYTMQIFIQSYDNTQSYISEKVPFSIVDYEIRNNKLPISSNAWETDIEISEETELCTFANQNVIYSATVDIFIKNTQGSVILTNRGVVPYYANIKYGDLYTSIYKTGNISAGNYLVDMELKLSVGEETKTFNLKDMPVEFGRFKSIDYISLNNRGAITPSTKKFSIKAESYNCILDKDKLSLELVDSEGNIYAVTENKEYTNLDSYG